MEIRAFLMDDEQRAIAGLKGVLNTFFPDVKIVGSANTVIEAYKGILSTKPNVVFLDVEMGAETGFNLLEKFEAVDFHVIFLTAHEEFALRAIHFSALDYLIKPAEVEELKRVIRKVQNHPSARQPNLKVKHMVGNFTSSEKDDHKITLSVADGYEFVEVKSIRYILADGSYSQFYLKSGEILTVSKNLKFYAEILKDYGFFRIHKSRLINLKCIKKIRKSVAWEVIMEDEREFGISKTYKPDFIELLSLK